MKDLFRRFSRITAKAVGSVWAFFIALLIIIVWAVSGPLFHFSDTWQLVINTGTTIVTFLMVFLIQATQNRDSREIHLKLDELLRAIAKARTGMADLDDLSDRELDHLLGEFHKTRKKRGMAELVEKEIEARAEEDDEDGDEDGEDESRDE
ncbi:MAG TPA: low affinity iron permease family protein [Thermoanaerobaculia bacterium]|nr:low affinity iron permease family protein [Thermoanaerobaculia bacterium]